MLRQNEAKETLTRVKHVNIFQLIFGVHHFIARAFIGLFLIILYFMQEHERRNSRHSGNIARKMILSTAEIGEESDLYHCQVRSTLG